MYIWGDKIGSFLRDRTSLQPPKMEPKWLTFSHLLCHAFDKSSIIHSPLAGIRREGIACIEEDKEKLKDWRRILVNPENQVVLTISTSTRSWDTHPWRGHIMNAVTNDEIQSSSSPWFKNTLQELVRLCLSFHFDLQEETNEVMTQELQGLLRLSKIEWLCDLIFLADVFSSLSNDSSKVPENSYPLCLTVWIHLKEHWNDCKSLIQAWTKKDATSFSVPLWMACVT